MTSRNCLLNLVFVFNKLSVNKPCYLVTKKRGFSSLLTRKYVESTRYFCSNAKNINLDENADRAISASSVAFLNNLSYEDIVGKDEKLLTKLKVILLEIDIMRQDGFEIPSKISLDRWKELVAAPTRSQRIKLLSFLFKTEKKKERDLRKKEERKKKMEVLKEENALKREENGHITYGFSGSTIFLRIYDTKIDAFHNNKLVSAMRFGQNLVLDCSYDEHMTPKEASLCAKQLMIMFSENRKDDEPFNLHFCNADKGTKVIQKLNKLIPTLYDDEFPLNITDKSYLDLFPKENLVYLTPHCREDLASFSHDDIYIIGGMVDKVSNEQISLGKAKRLGLRMAKFPLDRYLLWHIGSKSLTLNQVLLILLEMKRSGNWSKAFEHVPQRKLLKVDELNFKPSKGPSVYRDRMRQFNRF